MLVLSPSIHCTHSLIGADVGVRRGRCLPPLPTRVQYRDVAKIVPRPELVVAIAIVIVRCWRASVLEVRGMPVLMNRVVELAKVKLAVVSVLLLKILPIIEAVDKVSNTNA